MQTGKLITAMALGAGLFCSSAALAQSLGGAVACGERESMVQRLERAFGEVQKGAGLVNAGQLVEVWRSDETGTWTILMTDPEGMSCIVAAGEGWRDIDEKLIAKGDPA
jgi:hypothetical protein